MPAPLKNVATIYREIKERLIALYPEMDGDDDYLLGSLDGLTDFADVAVNLFESARHDEDMADAAKARAKEISERGKRFADRAATKRGMIAEAMSEAGRDKIEASSVTLSLRKNAPIVVVTDAEKVPAVYKIPTTTHRIDLVAVKSGLANGEVPGAEMSNGSVSLSARVR